MVPDQFKVKTNVVYPPYNSKIFEEYFSENFNQSLLSNDYIYLDIMWTNYYISKNYGNSDISELQHFLDSLDRGKKYFTIVQYDDCILNELGDLDIFIFSQGGPGNMKRSLYPIPLICMENGFSNKNKERDIIGSFIGAMNGRHELRRTLAGLLSSKQGFLIEDSSSYSSLPDFGYANFKNILETSIFSLCPRGYGATSFRICESLQHGSIPVYIYDIPWIPFKDFFNFEDIGLLFHESEIQNIEEILRNKKTEEIDKLVENGKKIYKEYFSYEGCFNSIIRKVNSL